MSKKQAWKSQREGFEDSLIYLAGRMRGEITSIQTPWPKWNDAGTNGFEWHSTIVVGGRPGSGKTLIKDQIIREAFPLNPAADFRVLEFQLEMIARTSAIREYSSYVGKTYKYLCSADGKLTQEDLELCRKYAEEKLKYPIDVVEDPCTVDEFARIIEEYMEAHATTKKVRKVTIGANGVPTEEEIIEKVYKKTIITLDHALLLKKAAYEKDKYETLYNLGDKLTALKRKYPICFIILSQLNRNIDNPERSIDGVYGNYILESDLFGADALLQHADILVGINRPGKQRIQFYGPDRYIIDNDKVLVIHFLKCRNGDTRLSFFKAEFEKMSISEMTTPPTASRKINTKI